MSAPMRPQPQPQNKSSQTDRALVLCHANQISHKKPTSNHTIWTTRRLSHAIPHTGTLWNIGTYENHRTSTYNNSVQCENVSDGSTRPPHVPHRSTHFETSFRLPRRVTSTIIHTFYCTCHEIPFPSTPPPKEKQNPLPKTVTKYCDCHTKQLLTFSLSRQHLANYDVCHTKWHFTSKTIQKWQLETFPTVREP